MSQNKMHYVATIKCLLLAITAFMSVGCHSLLISNHHLVDFGDPNANRLKSHFYQLAHQTNSEKVVRITQFGDSHTAADLFTGELRTRLQKKYGDAGIGWISPLSIKGQYHSSVKWDFSDWVLLNSISENKISNEIDFPMGGYIAKPRKSHFQLLKISPNQLDNSYWDIKVQLKINGNKKNSILFYDKDKKNIPIYSSMKQEKWNVVSATLKMPLYIKAASEVEIGSIWLEKKKQAGVIISPIATNGAQLSIWKRWNPNWLDELASSKSDLVILAYGVNESFSSGLDIQQYKLDLITSIKQIRYILPNAAILIISPPDTLTERSYTSNLFLAIKDVQRKVAQSEKTLFWDWQEAMGGRNAIKKWFTRGLAKPDMVHQTISGYKRSAKIFYTDFVEFVEKK